MRNTKLYIFCLIALAFSVCIHRQAEAQVDCSLILKQAEKLYEDGAIDSIPRLLDSCMNSGFNKKEKLQAYKMFILINLYRDRQVEAEKYMFKLLALDPEYEANRSIEEPEFLSLFDNFLTSSVWACGVYGGVNFSNIRTIEEYGVHSLNEPSTLKSASAMSYQFGLKYNRFLYKNIELNIDLQFAQNKYKVTRSIFNFTNISFTETQTRLSIPLTATCDLGTKKIKPYARLGFSVGYLLNSKAIVVRSYSDNSHAEVKGSEMDLKNFRNPFNIWAIGGIGLKYKVKHGNIFFDARYNLGVFNQSKSRYDNQELIYKYYYIDNNFTINNLSVSLGYVYLFYKPMKK
ncbi:MAG: PorT family protein [Bacteroidia bacterium]|nr:PorT family protein [Bacteroidia bacterium]